MEFYHGTIGELPTKFTTRRVKYDTDKMNGRAPYVEFEKLIDLYLKRMKFPVRDGALFVSQDFDLALQYGDPYVVNTAAARIFYFDGVEDLCVEFASWIRYDAYDLAKSNRVRTIIEDSGGDEYLIEHYLSESPVFRKFVLDNFISVHEPKEYVGGELRDTKEFWVCGTVSVTPYFDTEE